MGNAVAVRIRAACEQDLDAINRIYNDEILTGVASWDELPWTIEERRAWFADHGPLTPILVAVSGHAGVVGFAYLSLMSQKRGWRFSREDTIYLDPGSRGQGIGKILLGALLDEARRLGLRLIVASITSTNAASIELHRRFGFEIVGALQNAGYKFGEWRDTTYMQLDLGEPATLLA